jgi:hypothetical protein
MKFYNVRKKFANVKAKSVLAIGSATVPLTAGVAFADPATPVETLFNAVDISSLTTLVLGIMTAVVGLRVLFLGFRYLKRTLSQG